MRTSLASLFFAVTLSLFTCSVRGSSEALLVGVSKYENDKLFPDLADVEEGLGRLGNMLKTYGFHVDTRINPTYDTFRKAVEDLAGKTDSRRSVLFFTGRADDRRNTTRLYLTDSLRPYDGKVEEKQRRYFGLDDLTQILSRSKANVWVFIDGCNGKKILSKRGELIECLVETQNEIIANEIIAKARSPSLIMATLDRLDGKGARGNGSDLAFALVDVLQGGQQVELLCAPALFKRISDYHKYDTSVGEFNYWPQGCRQMCLVPP